VIEYPIRIPLAFGVKAGMKINIRLFAVFDNNIFIQQRVKSFLKRFGRQPGIASEIGSLPQRMNPGVGSAGSDHADRLPKHGLQRFFNLSLNGRIMFLTLPSRIVRAVIFNEQPEIAYHNLSQETFANFSSKSSSIRLAKRSNEYLAPQALQRILTFFQVL
jgi:hypothetical protein